MAEYTQLLDLNSLATHVEECILRRLSSGEEPGSGCLSLSDPFAPPSSSSTSLTLLLITWKGRVHKAMYRLLLLGAVCAGTAEGPDFGGEAGGRHREAYEPLRDYVRGHEQLPNFTASLDCRQADIQPQPTLKESSNQWPSGDSQRSQWARWFRGNFDDSFKQTSRFDRGRRALGNLAEEYACDEIAVMSIVLDALRTLMVNADGSNRHSRRKVFEPVYRGRRQMPLVIFGIFQPEIVHLPPAEGDLIRPWLLSEPIYPPFPHGRTPESTEPARPAMANALNQVADWTVHRTTSSFNEAQEEPWERTSALADDDALLLRTGAPDDFTPDRLVSARQRLTNGTSGLHLANSLNGLAFVSSYVGESDERSSFEAPFGFMFDMAKTEREI